MKKFSWEIVVAGLVFVFVAIYLMGRPADSMNEEREVYSTQSTDVPAPPPPPKKVQIIDLQNLKELKELEKLKEMEQLDQSGKLETLMSLKDIAHLIPSETREEFLTELDYAIQELSNSEVRVNINLDENLIILNRDVDVIVGSWVRTSPGVYTYMNEFSASEIKGASIQLPAGNITVIGTKDTTATFTLEASGQINNDDQLDKLLSTSAVSDNGNVTFKVSSQGDFYQQNIQLQATVYVPENTEISGNTRGGHIEITNIDGDQVYETGGGHIKLKQVSGDIVAVTRGGHMWADGGSGDLTFNSTGGHLTIKSFNGDVALKTAGGNILIKNVLGEINCSTSGGNIDIDLTSLTDDITAETSAGNIHLMMPANISAEVDLKGSTGVEINGFTLTDASKTKSRIRGEINGGQTDIVAYTKYGNVLLKSND